MELDLGTGAEGGMSVAIGANVLVVAQVRFRADELSQSATSFPAPQDDTRARPSPEVLGALRVVTCAESDAVYGERQSEASSQSAFTIFVLILCETDG